MIETRLGLRVRNKALIEVQLKIWLRYAYRLFDVDRPHLPILPSLLPPSSRSRSRASSNFSASVSYIHSWAPDYILILFCIDFRLFSVIQIFVKMYF